MTVGILTIVLSIPGSDSLRTSARCESILDSARNRFNVSAAEIDHWTRTAVPGLPSPVSVTTSKSPTAFWTRFAALSSRIRGARRSRWIWSSSDRLIV